MSSDQVGMRPIVDRMTDACKNITFLVVGNDIKVHSNYMSKAGTEQLC